MSLTRDEHRIRLGGSEVAVIGETGMVNATWTLDIDDQQVDRDTTGARNLTLLGVLDDGTSVEARVHQGALGPTVITILHDGAEVTTYRGFVA